MIQLQDFAILVWMCFLVKHDSPVPTPFRSAKQMLEFRKAVIATGARASAPPIPGLQDVPYLTNETLFSLTELPPRLGVIGAGPIGCEMAQAFASLGSKVLLVEAEHGILPIEDPEASEILGQSLQKDGVQLLCCGKELTLRCDTGKIQVSVESSWGTV